MTYNSRKRHAIILTKRYFMRIHQIRVKFVIDLYETIFQDSIHEISGKIFHKEMDFIGYSVQTNNL